MTFGRSETGFWPNPGFIPKGSHHKSPGLRAERYPGLASLKINNPDKGPDKGCILWPGRLASVAFAADGCSLMQPILG